MYFHTHPDLGFPGWSGAEQERPSMKEQDGQGSNLEHPERSCDQKRVDQEPAMCCRSTQASHLRSWSCLGPRLPTGEKDTAKGAMGPRQDWWSLLHGPTPAHCPGDGSGQALL